MNARINLTGLVDPSTRKSLCHREYGFFGRDMDRPSSRVCAGRSPHKPKRDIPRQEARACRDFAWIRSKYLT